MSIGSFCKKLQQSICGHKFRHIGVYSDAVIHEAKDGHQDIDYKLYCANCGKKLTLKYTKALWLADHMERMKKIDKKHKEIFGG